MLDEEGYTPFNESSDPMSDEDETTVQVPQETLEEEESGENDSIIIYEGICRSFEKHTTSDRGEVITSYRGLALPLTQDDWTRLGVVPEEGDEIAVDRGAYREYGHVVDKNPANFHGTHLTWRYGRN